jgi:tRNA(Ile)-lysidine synthase
MPLLTWAGNELRRYRGVLYAMPAMDGFDPGCILEWDMTDGLDLPAGMGRLCAKQVNGRGLNAALCRSRVVTVRYRHGGERCKPVGDNHTRSIKKLFQEQGIPPWMRDKIPFIYIGDQQISGFVSLVRQGLVSPVSRFSGCCRHNGRSGDLKKMISTDFSNIIKLH